MRDYLGIARARRLGARIGCVEFSLTQADLAALRHFADKIPAQSTARADP